jgi:hypothetical protein
MNLLLGHDSTVAEWVGRMVGKPFNPPFTAIGVLDTEGTLRGGFVFTSFIDQSIELSLAGKASMTREAWAGVLAYVFDQLGCKRLSVHTRRGNKVMRRQVSRTGFFFEGVARRIYGNEDGLTFSLTVDDLPAFRKKWRL